LARRRGHAVALDRLYLARACELAARGIGNTAPNPPVGAVLVRDGTTLGEGFHHRRGAAHAEVEALRAAGGDAAGATLYVTLEPCDHAGLTPPCAPAVVSAGVTRVVVGALDPNPRTAQRGVARLRAAGIVVDVVDDPEALRLIEPFAVAVRAGRPFVTLKMAASLDGFVAPRRGAHWLTGDAARTFVRELRAAHDMVLVGAGTVLADDPQLTVRPPHARAVAYRRGVVCDGRPLPPERRVFAEEEGYAPTVVLAAGPRALFGQLERVAEVAYIGAEDAPAVDLLGGLRALRERGVSSVLCEGGPRLAARLLAAGVVDRLEWLSAPRVLSGPDAVPALGPGAALDVGWTIDAVERLGDDVRLSAHPSR
jgi:diaminohydroxyphosphoribosylaminopyrimidine deaminase / 5-amino-6-(5-phosphoribosylamino)uracil reductase